MISLFDESLKGIFVLVAVSGCLYATANWRDARSDWQALQESSYGANPVLRIISKGIVIDLRRVALAQGCLAMCAVGLLFVPDSAQVVSILNVVIFLMLIGCSVLLLILSFYQGQRRKELKQLLRRP